MSDNKHLANEFYYLIIIIEFNFNDNLSLHNEKIGEIEASKVFNKNLKMPYNKQLIIIPRPLGLYGKILNLGLAALTSLSLRQDLGLIFYRKDLALG